MSGTQRMLHLRVLALQSILTLHDPHIDAIERLGELKPSRLGMRADEINHLTWRYRRQISPELVPWERGL